MAAAGGADAGDNHGEPRRLFNDDQRKRCPIKSQTKEYRIYVQHELATLDKLFTIGAGRLLSDVDGDDNGERSWC